MQVAEALKKVSDRLSVVEAKIASTWGVGLTGLECSNCRKKGLCAIAVKCTVCDKEEWVGWYPENK